MQPHRTRRGGPYRGLPDKRSDAQPLAIGGNYDGTYFVLVELHFPALASGYHHTVLYTVCAAQRKTQKEPRSAQAPERGKLGEEKCRGNHRRPGECGSPRHAMQANPPLNRCQIVTTTNGPAPVSRAQPQGKS